MFRSFSNRTAWLILSLSFVFCATAGWAQMGNSGSIEGVVADPSGGAVANATVHVGNPVSGFQREASTNQDGAFRFTNVPFNTYHLVVTAPGFAAYTQDVDVRSSVPTSVKVGLKVGAASESVTVVGGEDLIETDPSFHTDVDRGLFEKLPLESQSSSVSSLVTLSTPGVVADSNGLFHGLGDHAENSFSVDGQPITDQQSKVFSNQIPADSIQSLEVLSGAPTAEFGDKTSLIIKVTTRSGLGQTKPTGSVTTSYGSFGTVTGGFNLGIGSQKVGNFISVNGLNTGRFLDPPEFQVMHARGNQQNVFDRVDFQLSDADSIHLNLGYTRSWFQTPNSFDNLNVGATDPLLGRLVGPADQRAQIKTFNIAPTWTRLISPTTLFTLGAFMRRDQFGYYPSANAFADLPETFAQNRKLTNVGLRTDISYVSGIHNVKLGATFQHTFLRERFSFGITDPAANSPCVDANGAPVGDPTLTDPSQCAGAGFQPNVDANPNATSPPFIPILGCFDLSRPTPAPADGCAGTASTRFAFLGRADIKEIALYLQDQIKVGNWAFNLGVRGDLYRGITSSSQAEPRLGIAYNIKPTNTVLRVSYARVLETPFNENLVLSSVVAGTNPAVAAVGRSYGPIRPGQRNQFNAGFQQAFGKHLVVDADYMWKYTHNGYDFNVLLNTPIFFPIAWHNSKIDGVSARISVPNYHGLTAFVVLGHVNARFFPPQTGGLGATTSAPGVFRIDHDQVFQQTTHVQFQPWKSVPWVAFNWRYDSGLVASNPAVADFASAINPITGLTPNQQATVGLFCGNLVATPTAPLTTARCAGRTPVGAQLLDFGTNPDHNPSRVKPRHLFDLSVGDDNLFRGDRYRWSLRLTAVNLTNKVAAYNFLSTFSGTHFVTPRAFTAEVGFHF